MAYSFDAGHIAIRTVHSVKYVAAHLSSITTVPSGTDCQICHDLRHSEYKTGVNVTYALACVCRMWKMAQSRQKTSLPSLDHAIYPHLALF